jgi:hypothetical protein
MGPLLIPGPYKTKTARMKALKGISLIKRLKINLSDSNIVMFSFSTLLLIREKVDTKPCAKNITGHTRKAPGMRVKTIEFLISVIV